MEVATEVTIEASSAAIWHILADVERYPQWNPYIRELHGELVPGAPLHFRFSLLGSITLPARASVLTVTVERELRWAGHLLRDKLFRAEHYHRLDLVSERTVRFRHGERFSGVLTVLLWPFLRAWAPGRYRAVNLALKQRAESALTMEQRP
jgi:hypothetical protein